jgi:small subunit ribosomal protein S20
MANSKQAEKRGRQTIKRTAHNTSIKTRVKNTRKALATAVAAGDKDSASQKLLQVASAADRAAKCGVIHKSAADRIKSRSTKAVAKLG